MPRVGLAEAERVLPGDRGEAVGEPKQLQQLAGGRGVLVSADREPPAGGSEAVERRLGSGKRTAVVGHVAPVVREERLGAPVKLGAGDRPSRRGERRLDHHARAVAYHRHAVGDRHGRDVFLAQNRIQRVDEVAGRIDQRAVEIEHQRRRIVHRPLTIHSAP